MGLLGGLFGGGKGGEIGKILKKRYKSRHAFDKFKMKEASQVLGECAASLQEQGLGDRIVDDYVVDVDVDMESEQKVVTVSYEEGREFFRETEEGNWERVEPGS